jgi:hypothetical protein
VLDEADKRALVGGVYSRMLGAPERTLAEWERAWLARRLPPSGRVLVGAAGVGPEVRWLVARGHAVDALEPSSVGAQACERVAAGGLVAQATYEELANAVLDGAPPGPLGLIAARSYDAVLLGWGSFAHVLDADARLRLIVACARLSPRGPILASIVRRDLAPDPFARAREAGARVGGVIARALGRIPQAGAEACVMGDWFGLAHPFTREEIESLAAAAGRRVIFEGDDPYPHVTLVA